MPIANINNINLYYEIRGEGEPLVIIGGLATDITDYLLISPGLSKFYQLILLDNRGAGRSEVPSESFTIGMMAADVFSLLQKLNIQKTHILGHSMGGMIAQSFASQFPELVDKLILYSSSAKPDAAGLAALTALGDLKAANVDLELQVKINLPWVFSDNFFQNPHNVASAIAMSKVRPYPQTALGYQQQLNALQQFDSSDYLAKITAETLVIGGENDKLLPAKDSEYLAEQIENSTLDIIPEVGHCFHLETPQVFNEHILSFLRK